MRVGFARSHFMSGEEQKNMSNAGAIEKKTEELLLPIVGGMGFELVDVEYVKEAGNWYLRVYIDKPGGVSIDDCVAVSRAFDPVLDKEDYISDVYTFEVSSPGLNRPLKKEKDFIRAKGKDVFVRTYQKREGQKEFIGTLEEFDAGSVTVTLQESGEKIVFAKKEIAQIRMADVI